MAEQNEAENRFQGFLAEVIEVEKRAKTGIYGEIYFIVCKILEGKDKNRIIKRNVVGPIKSGDIIRLPDTNREAREIKVK
ncbi:MAG: 30S ribosomal protein S28e [Candidatus Marsarchaeota archaeon]|jgi:small subunit ribosomal protein S28e|nr:30S ribosomal protein S28e [Candidatus Marsarchaeota archaeon]